MDQTMRKKEESNIITERNSKIQDCSIQHEIEFRDFWANILRWMNEMK